MLEFIFDRYNYWIVIVLMMMGLYIVFSRGNLVKKIIGLNIFQTSVFIFYITIGKVAGGTAPIFLGGHGDDASHGDASHGDAGHGDDANHHESAGHGPAGDGEVGHGDNIVATEPGEIDLTTDLSLDPHSGESLHSGVDVEPGLIDKTGNAFAEGVNADLLAGLANQELAAGSAQGLHSIPQGEEAEQHAEALAGKIGESAFADAKALLETVTPGTNATLHIEETTLEALAAKSDNGDHGEGAGHGASHGTEHGSETGPETGPATGPETGAELGGDLSVDHAVATADIIYSNPLPHVLILTAIVVGVATTAVGLALAVRIREAYGTIEEDELEAEDDVAEFGEQGSFPREDAR